MRLELSPVGVCGRVVNWRKLSCFGSAMGDGEGGDAKRNKTDKNTKARGKPFLGRTP